MDIVTNTLVGIALSRLFFRKRVPYATLGLIVAVNLPDIDVLYSWPGIRYVQFHGGILHSVWMLPVWALLVAYGMRRLAQGRKRPVPGWAAGFALGAIGVGAHLLLDWAGTYGIRFLAPFSQHRFALDWLPSYDPWLWLILAAFLGFPMLLDLVTAEVGVHQRSAHRVSALIALLLCVGWIGLRARQHGTAVSILNTTDMAEMYESQKPLRWAAFPITNTPFSWSGVVDLPQNYLIAGVTTPWDTNQTSVKPFRSYIKPPQDPAITRAEASHTGKIFLAFAQFPFASDQQEANLSVISMTDMRYAQGYQQPELHADVTLNQTMAVVRQAFHW
ncbi:MAG: metal-dependent hydrolase [Terriglobales bacterium]